MARGRPKLEINEVDVEKLATMCCTMNEMASFFSCSVDTLERNYAEVIKKGRDKGKISLRREQYLQAMKGNITMLIWLGKQLLDQRDKVNEYIKDDSSKDERLAKMRDAVQAAENAKKP